MKRRHYLLSLIIDILVYIALTVITTNFIVLIIAQYYTGQNLLLEETSLIVRLMPYINTFVYVGYLYFYFIFIPYKNKQGTLGDVFTNIRLNNGKKITQLFLVKRLFMAFIGNLLFFISFFYMFSKKSKQQTLHDNLLKSKYEHVIVTKNSKPKKSKKSKK